MVQDEVVVGRQGNKARGLSAEIREVQKITLRRINCACSKHIHVTGRPAVQHRGALQKMAALIRLLPLYRVGKQHRPSFLRLVHPDIATSII